MKLYETSTTLRDYVRVLFRQKSVIILTVITVVATVGMGLKLKTPVYEAQVKILISAEKQVESPYYRELLGQRNAEVSLTQSEIVRSKPVIERAVQVLGLAQQPLTYEGKFASPLRKRVIEIQTKRLQDKIAQFPEQQQKLFIYQKAIEDLKKKICVEPIRDTNMFTITVKDFNSVRAMQVANTVSRSYVIFDLEQQLAELTLKYGKKHPTIKQLKDSIEEMEKRLGGEVLPDVEAIGPASVKIIEQAIPPLKPAGTPEPLTFILAAVMSIFLGVMLAFTFEYLDQTFKSPQEVETVLELPVLGDIPIMKRKRRRLLKNLKRITPYVKSYMTVADQLALLSADRNVRGIVFTSAKKREGTSTIIANAAKCLAEKGRYNILVIDANFRGPALHTFFGIEEYPGLAEVLEGKKKVKDMIRALEPGLNVLPAGRTDLNPVTLLNSTKMAQVMEEVKGNYDLLLIDCAPLGEYKDAVVISAMGQSVMLIVNEGITRREVAKKALIPFTEGNANVLGVILNRRTFAIPKMIYERI